MTDEQAKTLVYRVAAWVKHDMVMLPEDLLNILIDMGMVSKYTVDSYLEMAMKEEELRPRLPNNHINIC